MTYECDHCPMSYRSCRLLESHIAKTHNNIHTNNSNSSKSESLNSGSQHRSSPKNSNKKQSVVQTTMVESKRKQSEISSHATEKRPEGKHQHISTSPSQELTVQCKKLRLSNIDDGLDETKSSHQAITPPISPHMDNTTNDHQIDEDVESANEGDTNVKPSTFLQNEKEQNDSTEKSDEKDEVKDIGVATVIDDEPSDSDDDGSDEDDNPLTICDVVHDTSFQDDVINNNGDNEIVICDQGGEMDGSVDYEVDDEILNETNGWTTHIHISDQTQKVVYVPPTASGVPAPMMQIPRGPTSEELEQGFIVVTTTENQLKYICLECSKVYTSRYNIRMHVNMHVGKNVLQCQFCQRVFSHKHVFEAHVRTHTGEKPFTCMHCGKGFGDRSNRLCHQKKCKGQVSDRSVTTTNRDTLGPFIKIQRLSSLLTDKSQNNVVTVTLNTNSDMSNNNNEEEAVVDTFNSNLDGVNIKSEFEDEDNSDDNLIMDDTIIVDPSTLKNVNYDDIVEENENNINSDLEEIQIEPDIYNDEEDEQGGKSPKKVNNHKEMNGKSGIDESSIQLSCAYCDDTFENQLHLLKHVSDHVMWKVEPTQKDFESGFITSNTKKKHLCLLCGLVYLGDRDVKNHVDEHKDENSFECETCEEDFISQLVLQRHSKRHSLACPHCSAEEGLSTEEEWFQHESTCSERPIVWKEEEATSSTSNTTVTVVPTENLISNPLDHILTKRSILFPNSKTPTPLTPQQLQLQNFANLANSGKIVAASEMSNNRSTAAATNLGLVSVANSSSTMTSSTNSANPPSLIPLLIRNADGTLKTVTVNGLLSPVATTTSVVSSNNSVSSTYSATMSSSVVPIQHLSISLPTTPVPSIRPHHSFMINNPITTIPTSSLPKPLLSAATLKNLPKGLVITTTKGDSVANQNNKPIFGVRGNDNTYAGNALQTAAMMQTVPFKVPQVVQPLPPSKQSLTEILNDSATRVAQIKDSVGNVKGAYVTTPTGEIIKVEENGVIIRNFKINRQNAHSYAQSNNISMDSLKDIRLENSLRTDAMLRKAQQSAGTLIKTPSKSKDGYIPDNNSNNVVSVIDIHPPLSDDERLLGYCRREIGSSDSLELGRRSASSKVITRLICVDCGKHYTTLYNMRQHRHLHTNSGELYTCQFCNKRFTHRHIWNTHQRIHTGERPFKCDKCSKDFADRSNYNSHRKSFHKFEDDNDCVDKVNLQFMVEQQNTQSIL